MGFCVADDGDSSAILSAKTIRFGRARRGIAVMGSATFARRSDA